MPMIKEGWANALEPGIREWVFLGMDRRASLIPALFDILGSAKSSEHFGSIGAISPDAWDQFKKTKVPATVSFDEGYKKTFTHETFMVELPIEAELIEDNLYPQIMDQAGMLGDSFGLKKEVDGANIFNRAFTAAYTGADAVSLCNDSHPNGPTVSGTQDNSYALALTKDNVKTLREAMYAFKDDRGNVASVVPTMLLVPRALEDTAREIVESEKNPTNANNTSNPMYNRFNVVVWDFLTDSNAFFLIDEVKMKQSLKWFNRVPFSVRLKGGDTSVYATYIARARYSLGWRDWRWIIGSNPG